MNAPIRVGIVDSGIGADVNFDVLAARRFFFEPGAAVGSADATADKIGHGTEVSRSILAAAPGAQLLHAQVFEGSFKTAPVLVAAGIDWLIEKDARIINMSFGVAADRPVLGHACVRACDAGAILIASAPAQGRPTYPAGYDGVIAVTGDARCSPGEVSDLAGRQAEFGTWCASPEHGGGAMAGASAAAASFSGLVAAYLAGHPRAGRDEVVDHFRAKAMAVGPESRTVGEPRR